MVIVIRLPLRFQSTKGRVMNVNNVVVLQGRVSSEPRLRELPSGSAIVNLEVTTVVDDASISVPVVVESASVDCGAGDEVVVVGVVRRRFFRAGGATQSRTEVIAEKVVRTSRTRAAQKLLEGVAALLDVA
jgi:single-strand DNA-binding protein